MQLYQTQTLFTTKPQINVTSSAVRQTSRQHQAELSAHHRRQKERPDKSHITVTIMSHL